MRFKKIFLSPASLLRGRRHPRPPRQQRPPPGLGVRRRVARAGVDPEGGPDGHEGLRDCERGFVAGGGGDVAAGAHEAARGQEEEEHAVNWLIGKKVMIG